MSTIISLGLINLVTSEVPKLLAKPTVEAKMDLFIFLSLFLTSHVFFVLFLIH